MVRDREEEELHSTHPPPFWGDILGQHTKSEYPLRQIRLGINIERINSVNFTKDNILYFGCKQLQYYFCQGKWPTALMRRVQSPCSQFWGTWKFSTTKIIGKKHNVFRRFQPGPMKYLRSFFLFQTFMLFKNFKFPRTANMVSVLIWHCRCYSECHFLATEDRSSMDWWWLWLLFSLVGWDPPHGLIWWLAATLSIYGSAIPLYMEHRQSGALSINITVWVTTGKLCCVYSCNAKVRQNVYTTELQYLVTKKMGFNKLSLIRWRLNIRAQAVYRP